METQDLDFTPSNEIKVLPLCTESEVLSLKSDDFTPEELKDKEYLGSLVLNLTHTMYSNKAIGLAAIQIGEPKNLFVTIKDEIPVAINAKITYRSAFKSRKVEGCLSFEEGKTKAKTRNDFIRLSYYDADLNFHEDTPFQGYIARIIQHEMDHIEGKLF